LSRDRVSIAAGSLAYHGFLALFPAVIALLGVITLARLDGSDITHIINGIDKALPPGASDVFTAAVKAADKRKTGSTVAVIVGTVTALWSSSSAMAALQQALDMAYEVPVDRKFLSRRLNSLPLMMATIVLGGLGASLVVFGASIGSGIESIMPVKGFGFDVVWTAVRWLVTLLAMSALFAFFYYQGPKRERPTWQWVSTGGLVSTVVFVFASVGFSFYVSEFGSYGRIYGPFAGVAVLVFWMYLTALAVLSGGEINAELERQAAIQAGDPAAAASAQDVLSSTRPVPAHRRRPSP
jgi:membrane protein